MATGTRILAALLAVVNAVATTASAQEGATAPGAGDYLAQAPPGAEPRVFAPGIVSTGLSERDVAITPDGDEIFFSQFAGSYTFGAIMRVRRVDGRWQAPEVAPFSGTPGDLDLEPALSWDGAKLYFLSNRPDPPRRSDRNEDIWVSERIAGGGWSAPRALGAPVNSEHKEYFPSLTRSGTIYFTREDAATGDSAIFRCRMVDGAWTAAERLPAVVNSGNARFNAFVAHDESYLIYGMTGRKDSLGSVDYFVSFRTADDAWSEPVNLGPTVNTPGQNEYSPYVTRDGRYLFFMSGRNAPAADVFGVRIDAAALQRLATRHGNGHADIWWVDASFIETLRPPRPTP